MSSEPFHYKVAAAIPRSYLPLPSLFDRLTRAHVAAQQ